MDVLAICLAIAIFLFIALFVTKRKFGLLGLALATGSILSGLWVENSSYILGMLNVTVSALVVAGVSALIILLPALLMIFHDGKYKTFTGRLIGSSLFTLLALAFLVEPIGRVLIPQGLSATVYNWLVLNNHSIIAVGLVLSIIDLMMPKHKHSNEKHENH